MSARLPLARGFTFTHERMLDTTWRPGPGQKYADAPKVTMVVSRVTRDLVYFKPAGYPKTAPLALNRGVFEARYCKDTPCP